jgi:hypothetical protein
MCFPCKLIVNVAFRKVTFIGKICASFMILQFNARMLGWGMHASKRDMLLS